MSKRPLDPEFERDVALVRQAVSRGEARRHAEIEARKAELVQRAPELAAILFGAGARRVWHFGSLVWGRAHEASDIDLAVEGLPAASFFELYDRLCRAAGEPSTS